MVNILKLIWSKIRYGLVIQEVLVRLERIGIRIIPFYVCLEGSSNRRLPQLETGFDEYDIGFLEPQDMKIIAAIPRRNISEEKLLLMLKEGKKCFGVKYKGELVAFTWCDLEECNSDYYRFSLKENVAYLFVAFTLMTYRGRGIAPYMRYQIYKELAKLQRERIYTITDFFNSSSLRFKKKLNSRLLELILFVKLFNRKQFNLRLKKY